MNKVATWIIPDKAIEQNCCHNNNMPHQKRYGGFSLVEMLMALLVASLLLAALAPVMTKRMGETKINVSGITSANNGNETHGVKIFEYDTMADSDKEYSKYNFAIPTGVYTVSLVLQAGGGGGGGATSGYTSYDNILDTSSSATESITIEDNLVGIKNVRIDLTGGGAGGGGGIAPIVDCWEPNLHKYINPTQGNGTQQCVNKFNVGDAKGPALPSWGIKCTQGNTADKDRCNNTCRATGTRPGDCYYIGKYTDCHADPISPDGYSGCGRTTVQWHVAYEACKTYRGAKVPSDGTWRIPTESEVSKWTSYLSTLNEGTGTSGLQHCAWSNSNTRARCDGNTGAWGTYTACYGPPGDDCDPDLIWLRDPANNSFATGKALSGQLSIQTNRTDVNLSQAMSARCITTDNAAFSYAYKTGGGGGSGARIYNFTLPETYNGVKLLEKGNRISISRGNYGGGGDTGVNGGNGSPSCINVYNSSGVSIFYFCANGGNLGNAPTNTTYGTGGSANATCRIGTSSANFQNVNCSSYGSTSSQAGNNGASSTVGYNSSVSGGAGGKSTYNSSAAGGTGGVLSSAAGKAPTASGSNIPYGAGGGGGSSSMTTAGKGGNGYMGYAKITYDIERTGGSGGGGGGGGMTAVASLEVEAGRTYEIIAGKGGKGGNVNSDGADGYLSSFKYSDTKIIKANEGKGGKRGNSEGVYGIGGIGGKGGSKLAAGAGFGTSANAGKDGIKGYDYDIEKIKKSIGGNGGKSGIGTDGGCGGLTFYFDESSYASNLNIDTAGATPSATVNNCKITNTNADSALYLLNTLIMGTDYGKAGAGGGGGAFESYALYGVGGDGGNGYVYIKW